MKIKLSDYELGWLVGILEGEGCFGLNKGQTQHVQLEMTDEDVVNTASIICTKLIGKPIAITCVGGNKENAKECFRFQLYGESARIIMRAVVPYMHFRRRARVWQCINKYTPVKQSTFKELGLDITQLICKRKEQINDRASANERRSGEESDRGDTESGDDPDRAEPFDNSSSRPDEDWYRANDPYHNRGETH